MTEPGFDYPRLLQDALRQVIRRCLERVAEEGFPGGSHFYVAFRTDHPGVELPDELRRRYPEEMTIVLEHQFWDLEVEDERFSVTLAFAGVHRRLTVPFTAVTSFADPAADFGLRFTALETEVGPGDPAAAEEEGEEGEEAEASERKPVRKVVPFDAFRKR